MRLWLPAMMLSGTLLFGAADKTLPIEENSNELVEITANVLLNKGQAKEALGADPGEGIVVVRVRVRPLSEKPVRIDRDAFLLLSTGDGQHSTALDPAQIAGPSTLVLTPQGAHGGIGPSRSRPTFSGGGFSTGSPGGVGAGPDKVKAQVKTNGEDALYTALKAKVLPEKETDDPVSGLLYFQLDGKLKAKDLELYYKTPSGKLALRFRP